MGSQFELGLSSSRFRLRDDFLSGLECFKSDDYEAALALFRKADEDADIDDVYQNRYTSFHGLSRVFMGDKNGVKLCRKAAVGETGDVEVYYNLAMAEQQLSFRESALMALRRGLHIDPDHAGLQRLQKELSRSERRSVIPAFKSENVVSRMLGKFLGRSG